MAQLKEMDKSLLSFLVVELDIDSGAAKSLLTQSKGEGAKAEKSYLDLKGLIAKGPSYLESHIEGCSTEKAEELMGRLVTQLTESAGSKAVKAAADEVSSSSKKGGKGDKSDGSTSNDALTMLVNRLPPQDLYEALARLVAKPRGQQEQGWWQQHSKGIALLIESEETPGRVDEALTKDVIELYLENGTAPKTYKGNDVLTLSELLKKIYLGCVVTGRRLVDGKPLGVEGISYAWIKGVDEMSLADAQQHLVFRLISLARSEGLLRPGDVQNGQRLLNELKQNLGGKTDERDIKEIRRMVDGTAWEAIATEYSKDKRAGGIKVQGAVAHLAVQSNPPSIPGAAPYNDPLFGGLLGGGNGGGQQGGRNSPWGSAGNIHSS